MHTHRIAGFGRNRPDRRQLVLAGALALALTALVALAPWLFVLAAAEWKLAAGRRRKPALLGLAGAALLWRAVVWLWLELREAPHRPWHPCAQCGRPVEQPSRAAYCSHECRRWARLERQAAAVDPVAAAGAERQLRSLRLRRLADGRPEWQEVPF